MQRSHRGRLTTFLALLALSALSIHASAQQTLVGWGSNSYGQTTPPPLPAGVLFTKFAGGAEHTAALRTNNTIVAWGRNNKGQLNVTQAPPAGTTYTAVACTWDTTLARRSDGAVVAWGNNTNGLATVPPLLPTTTYTNVFAGPAALHALATRSDGWLVGWGYNSHGQTTTPPQPAGIAYMRAAAGGFHSVALLSNGHVAAWGLNGVGQTNVPPLPAGVTYTEVKAGEFFSLALRSDGNVAAWGSNAFGQLNVPPLPPGLVYTEIAASTNGAYALRSDGVIVNWGSSSTAPTATLMKYASVAAGGMHGLGMRVPLCEGIIYCTAKTNAIGCVPSIGYTGSPSMSGANDFFVTASNLTSQHVGMLIWGLGSFSAPFYGGTLCVAPPIVRTTPQNAGGNPFPWDCTGAYSHHFTHEYMSVQGLVPGTLYYAQYWMRDSHDPLGLQVGLSNALQFMLCQ